MAYCNIEGKFLGNKLNTMFYEQNRNILSSIIADKEFKDWFGEGRRDVDGNPVINEALSFTNQKGEKKTIFDFAPITLRNKGEVVRLLKSLPGIRQYQSELFINNTAKDSAGNYASRMAVQAINVINYYYPGLLSIDMYQRKGLLSLSKDKGIPLPIIKINNVSFNKAGLFSIYETELVDKNRDRFSQIRSVDELIHLQNDLDEYRQYGVSQAEILSLVDRPSINEVTYNKLKEFVKKINPNFKIEEIDNLSTSGAAYIGDFLIKLNTNAKFEAMPEEVSHFFFELLPQDSPLRKDMMDNITSFLIYSKTLSEYKNLKDYQKDNGNPDFDKIKREASAKLIAEFVTAQANGDTERLETLLKVKENFLKRWWDKFVSTIKSIFNIQKVERFKAFADAADAIMKEKIDYLSQEEIFNNSSKDVFFLLNDKNKVDIEMTKHILSNVTQAGKLGELQKVIDNFRNELRKNFIKIVKDDSFELLNKQLSKDEKGKDTEINYLSELYDAIKKVDVTEGSLNNMIASENQILNFSQFIYVIQNMDNVAKTINDLVDKYPSTGDIKMISELQSYRDIYSNFESFISNDLATLLAGTEVEFEVITTLKKAASAFHAVESNIIEKLRNSFKVFFKEQLDPFNEKYLNTFTTDIEKAFLYREQNPAHQQIILTSVKKFKDDVKSGSSVIKARNELVDNLSKSGLSKKILTSSLISELFDKINHLYTSDKMIDQFMHGMGKDIDLTSQATHLMTAAIKNHDIFVADIGKFIVNERSQAQNLARIAVNDFAAKVSPIIDKLKVLGEDEYSAGKAITDIDIVRDTSVNQKTGEKNYENDEREVVTLLKPTSNRAIVDKQKLLSEKNNLLSIWKNTDPNSPEALTAKENYKKARNDYNNFVDTYINGRYNSELTSFQKKWNENEEFLEVKEEWDILSESIRNLANIYEADKNDEQAYVDYLLKVRERSELLKTEGKDNNHIKKAQLLQQYFDEASKFRIEDEKRTERNYRLAQNNYENKLDYAIGTFLRKPDNDLDTLEKTLQEVMKDNTIKIKHKYMFETSTEDSISSTSVSTNLEVAYVKAILLGDFEDRNKVKVKNDLYYEAQEKLFKEIADLKSKDGLSEIDELITDLYKQINDLLVGKNDFYGQRNPEALSIDEKEKVHDLEDKLAIIKEYNIRTYKILDEVKQNKKNSQYLPLIQDYESKIKNIHDVLTGKGGDISTVTQDRKDIADLNKIFEMGGILSKEQLSVAKEVKELYKILGDLSKKKPTEVYWDKIEDLIPIIDGIMQQKTFNQGVNQTNSKVNKIAEAKEIDNLKNLLDVLNNAIYYRNSALLDKVLNDEYFIGLTPVEFKKYLAIDIKKDTSPLEDINPEFFDWFMNSHREGKEWVSDLDEDNNLLDTGSYMDRSFVRRLYYTHSDPNSNYDINGKKLYDIKPIRRFRATKINDDPNTGYLQKQITWKDSSDMEDWTVDNRSGKPEYLPLSRKQLLAQGKTDTKYLNKKYYQMKDSNSDKDKLHMQYLNETISTYFQEQDSKPDELKSGFNLPVTNLDHYSTLKADIEDAPDRIKRLGQKIKGLFIDSPETDAEDQLTGVDQIKDVDEFTQDIIQKKIPRLGMNVKLPVQRVNRNVLHAIQEYIIHSKDFDTRNDLNPFVKGLIDVLKSNETLGHQSQAKRTQIFDQIYNQMILQEMPNNISNQKFFRKTANILMSMTGIKLAADVVGGGINYLQANINNSIEAFAGKHASLRNYGVGYAKAGEMIGHLLMDFNKKEDFHLWTMMYQAFDFIQGEWYEDVTERASTKNKNFNWRKMLMYPRKNGELHAQSAMAISILDNVKVLNSIDEKYYPMWDIYKKDGNNLVLKEGFDEKYNPKDGKEFQRVKNLIWSTNLDLHGNYADINQTEASRHSIGKMMENMKRWFIPNFQRRFGREGIDVNKLEIDEGYYKASANFLWKWLTELLRGNVANSKDYFNYYWTTPRKRENLKRGAADLTVLVGLFFLIGHGFGYDYDDPDKNKKLKESSWFYNEALLLFLRTYAEHTAFIPVPPFGFTEMTRNLLDPFSVAKSALGNATGALSTLLYTVGYYLGIDSLENDAFYQKDSGAGKGPTLPWFWDIVPGQKGESKFAAYLAKSFGYNGSQIDPSFYIRNFEQLQNRLK